MHTLSESHAPPKKSSLPMPTCVALILHCRMPLQRCLLGYLNLMSCTALPTQLQVTVLCNFKMAAGFKGFKFRKLIENLYGFKR